MCKANSLLMGSLTDLNQLLIETQTRSIFSVGNLLVDQIDDFLLQYCAGACSEILWDPGVWSCFMDWSTPSPRSKRNSEFLSFLLRDGEQIQNVNSKLEKTISAYNSDFEKMSKYNKVIRKNMNWLGKRIGNHFRTGFP